MDAQVGSNESKYMEFILRYHPTAIAELVFLLGNWLDLIVLLLVEKLFCFFSIALVIVASFTRLIDLSLKLPPHPMNYYILS